MADHEDYQPGEAPAVHATTHEDGGADEISVADLDGITTELALHAAIAAAHHARYTDGEAIAAVLPFLNTKTNKTTSALVITVGPGADYPSFLAAINSIPNFLNHSVSFIINKGTTLAETLNIYYKHSITSQGAITVSAQEYFPQTGLIPSATSATLTTLVDNTQAWAIDRFIDCWVFIVDGTGTDNGFVKITDSGATSITVASWPGTQPDNTSRYIIVGALINGSTRYSCLNIFYNNSAVVFKGIGFYDSDGYGIEVFMNHSYVLFSYCGIYNSNYSGFFIRLSSYLEIFYNGIVLNNIRGFGGGGGFRIESNLKVLINDNGISDNIIQGMRFSSGGYSRVTNNFGDDNGLWGLKADSSAMVDIDGSECSGSSGNHTDPGTADTSSADQSAVY